MRSDTTQLRACFRHGIAGMLVCLALALPGSPYAAAPADDAAAHLVHLARSRPPCSDLPAMPIVPNDPGALVTPGGTRCYGTSPPELELWLPEDRYVWLERAAPSPAVWVDLGPIVVDPLTLDPPPLGLLLTAEGESFTLELRHGPTATLTPLESGQWVEARTPDGEELWVRVAGTTSSGSRPPEASDARPAASTRRIWRAD